MHDSLYGVAESGRVVPVRFCSEALPSWPNALAAVCNPHGAAVATPVRAPGRHHRAPADPNRWGSAHSSTFNMVFCDGSVHTIPYTIDSAGPSRAKAGVHQWLGNRADGNAFQIDF